LANALLIGKFRLTLNCRARAAKPAELHVLRDEEVPLRPADA